MKYTLAQLFVLRNGDKGNKLGLKNKLKEINFDFFSKKLYNDIISLSNKERIKFILESKEYIESFDFSKERKELMKLEVLFSSLPCLIDVKKEPVYSILLSIANNIVKNDSENFNSLKDIIYRHSGIKID